MRELHNVVERGVITATNGVFDIERALPSGSVRSAGVAAPELDDDRILTAAELTEIERANIIRALERTQFKVSGRGGAAELLKLNPSTLSSRMKALSIPRR